jgi:hypothetical protein
MARTYILKEVPSQKELQKSFRKAHKIIERAQKRQSRTGKDKSLLHQVCKLGGICHRDHITNSEGKKFTNPHTDGEHIVLEQLNPTKYVRFKNFEYKDVNGNLIILPGYKD